ncbi:growth hormone secretagogue receptor type 1 [Biomphalaria glabrata]|nr:growth hormone secretagogue receptor type 1-like [Biomphalaria glabrata]
MSASLNNEALQETRDLPKLDNSYNSSNIAISSDGIDDVVTLNIDSETIIFVNHVLLCSAIGLFGIVTNAINICVFIKQGLNTSINISLFSIALFDLVKIFAMQSINIVSNPLVIELVGSRMILDAFYLIGGWPAACAHRISLFITVYMTAERCLCVSFPLKIRTWITPRVAFITVSVIILVNVLTLIPEYTAIYIDWVVVPGRNTSTLGLIFTSNRPAMQGLTFIIHAIFLFVGIIVVVSLTLGLVLLIRRKSEWRNRNTTNDKQKYSLSVRDKKMSQLVILLATVLIVCYLPMVILSLVTVFMPDFTPEGKLGLFFLTLWSFGHVFGITNPSVNIFIYYKMSSYFREKFKELFRLVLSSKSITE